MPKAHVEQRRNPRLLGRDLLARSCILRFRAGYLLSLSNDGCTKMLQPSSETLRCNAVVLVVPFDYRADFRRQPLSFVHFELMFNEVANLARIRELHGN